MKSIRNPISVAFIPKNATKAEERKFRKLNPEFKGQRFRDILQTKPDQITFGKVYLIDGELDA